MVTKISGKSRKADYPNADGLERFFKQCAEHMGPELILMQTSDIRPYQENVTGYNRKILGVIQPLNTSQVVNAVAAANANKVALYPISTGRNWGLGSRLPTRDSSVVVDLSRMNRIIECDDKFGYMTIEPGVTQSSASEYLRTHNSSFMLDVTGAGSDTSILGNLLERGIGYNAQRADSLVNLEVVLGTGQIIKTGFAHYENSKIKHLHKYGVGCDLNGLFLQSNFGIVVSGTVELLPKGDSEATFVLNFSEQQLPNVIETLRILKQQSILSSIAHIGNKTRQKTILGPLLSDHYRQLGMTKSKKQIESIIDDIYPSEWTLLGGLSGTAGLVRVAKKRVYREFKKIGRVRMLSARTMSALERISKRFPKLQLPALLCSASSLRGLTRGTPTQDTLASLAWYYAERPMDIIKENPDNSPRIGLSFCLPFCPFDADSVRAMLKMIYDISAEHQFEPAITLNTVSRNVVEAVVSIHFDRSRTQLTDAAKAATRKMNREFMAVGFNPYRMNIEDLDLLIDEDDSYWQVVSGLKSILDPNNVIAPGRYNRV